MMGKKRVKPDGRGSKRVQLTCGVYEIVHPRTQRRYVGSSCEVEKRLYHHLCMLRVRRHHCQYLQNVWDKYGEAEFRFYILESCEVNALDQKEQYHMDCKSVYTLMNAQPVARSARGFTHSKETRVKMSVSARRVGANLEERQRRSKRAKRQHAEGCLGRRSYTISKRSCVVCSIKFTPHRMPSGNLSQSKYCPECRPVHRGGYYKYSRALFNEGRPKQNYPGI